MLVRATGFYSTRTYHVHVSKGRAILLLLSGDGLGLWGVLYDISRVANQREMERKEPNEKQGAGKIHILRLELKRRTLRPVLRCV